MKPIRYVISHGARRNERASEPRVLGGIILSTVCSKSNSACHPHHIIARYKITKLFFEAGVPATGSDSSTFNMLQECRLNSIQSWPGRCKPGGEYPPA